MFCQNCGKEIDNKAVMCPFCKCRTKKQVKNKGCIGCIIAIILIPVIILLICWVIGIIAALSQTGG